MFGAVALVVGIALVMVPGLVFVFSVGYGKSSPANFVVMFSLFFWAAWALSYLVGRSLVD